MSPRAFTEGLPQHDADVLHQVVVVHLQIAGRFDREIHPAMACQQVEHVIEKADAGADLALPLAVEVEVQEIWVSLVLRSSLPFA